MPHKVEVSLKNTEQQKKVPPVFLLLLYHNTKVFSSAVGGF